MTDLQLGVSQRLHSYSKVYNLGHPELGTLLVGPVVVQEKVDGSQFSFMRDFDGQLHFRSKGASIPEGTTDKLFAASVQAVMDRRELLLPGCVYRGEAFCRPKHNTLEYKRVPRGNVVLYDIDFDGNQNYVLPSMLFSAAVDLDFDVVPTLYEGELKDLETLKQLLTRESVLGGPIEGIVIKNYAEFGRDKKTLMGKHVREEFKEAHTSDWKTRNPNRADIVQVIGTSLRTDARFRKAVEHLRDAGSLTGTPKDIGPLLKELQTDLKAEMAEQVAAELLKHFWPDIQRKAIAGFAEWYKEQLMQAQFAAQADTDVPTTHEERVTEATAAVAALHGEALEKLAN